MAQFLVLQLRPETEVSDNEFAAICEKGELEPRRAHRIRLDREEIPAGLPLMDYAGVIVGGGPGCVSDPPERKTPAEARIERSVLGIMGAITDHDIPFLGCCYGIGILGHHLGAQVSQTRYGEAVGAVACAVADEGRSDPLIKGLPETFQAFVGHKEALQELPKGCTHLLSSATCPYQMVRYKSNVYATQFHPEADGEVFALRIAIYKDKGYFEPSEAANLTRMCRAADVRYPAEILRNFVRLYG